MTEPHQVADRLEKVTDGVWHWRIHNRNIGGAISSSHAVAIGGGCVLIDPIRLSEDTLQSLPPPRAILLTAATHQRASWRYRRELAVEVWLPEGSRATDEDPDHDYSEGDVLPGGLSAVHTPGPEKPHYSLLLERDPRVLFCSDLIQNDGGRELSFVSPAFHEDPAETRRSVERLLELDFSILCLDHGVPLTEDPKAELQRLLDS